MKHLNHLLNEYDYQLDPYMINFEVTGWLKNEEMGFVKIFYDEEELYDFVKDCVRSDDCYLQQVVVHYSITTTV